MLRTTFFIVSLLAWAWAGSSVQAAPPDAKALAARIDQLIAERAAIERAQPAPIADDAEFLRRLTLDLTGRIPMARDVRDFLADKAPDKRTKLIADLLTSPRHAQHFADVWRALLIPEVAANAEARLFQPGFEAWLYQKMRGNERFDRVVQELLTVPIAANQQNPESVLRNPEKPNPLAFFAVKDASPANLAATTSRLFLGIQIECAQCHKHPFATWTRDQFWNQAAFFAGIERQGDGIFAPLSETIDRREIVIGDTKKSAKALFLDQTEPVFKGNSSSRAVLASWITSPTNPYFARATVNRLWGLLMGRGIVEPVDDFNDDNLPSHPELLDELARAFIASDFDLRFILRSICSTHSYQRTSKRTHPSQANPRYFAQMAVKGLSGEQFFDSLTLATGYRVSPQESGMGGERNSVRMRFLDQFANAKLSEPETSILQALTLMNGKFIGNAVTLAKSPTLMAVCEMPSASTAERIESLYLMTLSRYPTTSESAKLADYVGKGGVDERNQKLADIFWMLLNSAEFRLNH